MAKRSEPDLDPPEVCEFCHKEQCACVEIHGTVYVDAKSLGGSMGTMGPNDKVDEGVTMKCDQVVARPEYDKVSLSDLRTWFRKKFMPALNGSRRTPCQSGHQHCSDVVNGWCSIAVLCRLEDEGELVSEALNQMDDSPEGELRRAAQDHKGRP